MERTIELGISRGSTGMLELAKIDRMQKILEALANSSADIVSLQECEAMLEKRIRDCKPIQSSYYLCSANAIEPTSNLLILSKLKPSSFQIVKLSNASEKVAAIVKLSARISSNDKAETILYTNLHLTSNKSLNAPLKRREQLTNLVEILNKEFPENRI
jgi:hypothetical protein